MAHLDSHLFGVLVYSLDLSYHDLQALEERLQIAIQDTVSAFSGQHLDFWGYGDLLRFEFALERFDPAELRDLAHDLAAMLPADVTARLVCVDKNLRRLLSFGLATDKVREDRRNLASLLDMDGLALDLDRDMDRDMDRDEGMG